MTSFIVAVASSGSAATVSKTAVAALSGLQKAAGTLDAWQRTLSVFSGTRY